MIDWNSDGSIHVQTDISEANYQLMSHPFSVAEDELIQIAYEILVFPGGEDVSRLIKHINTLPVFACNRSLQPSSLKLFVLTRLLTLPVLSPWPLRVLGSINPSRMRSALLLLQQQKEIF